MKVFRNKVWEFRCPTPYHTSYMNLYFLTHALLLFVLISTTACSKTGGIAPKDAVAGTNPYWALQFGDTTTTSGGNNAGSDICEGITVDSSGNIYCAGRTTGSFAESQVNGNADIFIMKLNSAGVIQWVTQFGAVTGTLGGSTIGGDFCNGVDIDSSGNVYCAGYTTVGLGEGNSVTTSHDVVIMKLNSSGVLQWITQLGDTTVVAGGDNTGQDYCQDVAVDSGGNVYCAGQTEAIGEGNSGSSDAFVMKLNSSGAILWVTQLGDTTTTSGGDHSQYDVCKGIDVDSSDNIYCAGYTAGDLGEGNGGGMDAFIMKLNSSGAIQWVTQLGDTTSTSGGDSSQNEICFDISVDSSGNAHCAGYTRGGIGEGFGGGVDDAFVMKVSTSGALQWITQFGDTTTATSGGDNSGQDRFHAVSVDSSGIVYSAGFTRGDMAEGHGGGSDDIMIIKVNSSGGGL